MPSGCDPSGHDGSARVPPRMPTVPSSAPLRVTVVGAGCLGSVYAAHLAKVVDLTVVARDPGDRGTTTTLRVGRDLGGLVQEVVVPRASLAPLDTEVVLLAVRSDQAEAALESLAAASAAVVVSLTPLLPPTRARLAATLGDRLVPAMAGAIAYRKDTHVAYYTPRSLPTRLGQPAPHHAARVQELLAALEQGGLPTTPPAAEVPGVVAATVTALLPILLGVPAAGGSIDAMLADESVLKLGLAATKECRAIAAQLGPLPGFVSLFLSFATPFTIRAGIKLGKSRAPASIDILEGHFGRRLATQNHALVRDVLAVAEGLPVDKLRALAARAGALP